MQRRSLLLGTAGLGLGLSLGAGIGTAAADLALGDTGSFPVVKEGARGAQARIVQAGVGAAIDGAFGPDTAAAVRTFQRARGLQADGVVGPATWSKMLSVVRLGSSGRAVSAVQTRLLIGVDGQFGSATLSAVKQFQSGRGITADGVVGPTTWGRMLAAGSGGGSGTDPRRAGYSNGQLPASALAWVGFGRSDWRMSTYCIANFKAMNSAFRSRFGINLPITPSNGVCYRDLATQRYLWDLYQSGRGNKAAYPGTSNHGWGLAADISVGGYGSSQYNWLAANAGRWGFDDRVSGESWHWEYTR